MRNRFFRWHGELNKAVAVCFFVIMNSRERLLTALNGGIPDRVPATVHQWQLCHYTKIMGVASPLEAFRQVGLDAVVYPEPNWQPSDHSNWRVETRLVDDHDPELLEFEEIIITPEKTLHGRFVRSAVTETMTEYLFKDHDDLRIIEKYMPVEALNPAEVLAFREQVGDSGILRMYTNGPQGAPWQDACALFGTENMIYHAFDDPDWTHGLLEVLLQKKLEFYKKNLAPLKGVFSMLETGGGAASNNVISPDMFEEFCLPYDRRQHELIHDIDPDIVISYHTCGGMMHLLDLIPQNGCNCSETLSPVGCCGDIRTPEDEARVKNVLGSKVLLMGGINQSELLEYGNEEQIRQDVVRCFNSYGKGGRYIMMPSDHFFVAPVANLQAYARAVRDICIY